MGFLTGKRVLIVGVASSRIVDWDDLISFSPVSRSKPSQLLTSTSQSFAWSGGTCSGGSGKTGSATIGS